MTVRLSDEQTAGMKGQTMDTIKDLRDTYIVTKDRIVFTEEQLHIPGVRMFGRHLQNNATRSIFWHYHKDAFEFSIPVKGTFSFSTESKDYEFSGGDIFVSFPNEIHGTNQVPVTVGDLYWFQIDISSDKDFLFLNRNAARHLIEQMRALPHHVVRTEIRRTVPFIRQTFDLAKNSADPFLTASHLLLFLHLLIRYSNREPFPMSRDIRKAYDRILSDPAQEFSLEDLADTAGLSCSQFKQKFRNQLGVSPRHFINAQKVEYAKKLLAEGKSVTETAMLLNFSTSSYFSTVFKKYTMYTPKEYIQRKRSTGVKDSGISNPEMPTVSRTDHTALPDIHNS